MIVMIMMIVIIVMVVIIVRIIVIVMVGMVSIMMIVWDHHNQYIDDDEDGGWSYPWTPDSNVLPPCIYL